MSRFGASLLFLAVVAAAGETPPAEAVPPESTKDEARAAIQAFTRTFQSKETEVRLAAIDSLAAVHNPLVADLLIAQAGKLKDPAQLAAVYRALARQPSSAAKIGPKAGRFVLAEAVRERERVTKGDPGFPMDPKTGEPAQDTPEARLALAESKARGAVIVEALRCLDALDSRDPADDTALAALLQYPHDEVVVETLRLLARRRSFHALPAMFELYRMYPDPGAMDTDFIVKEHGMSATGRKKWLALFGHPVKQRSRPAVVKALQQAVEQITGKPMGAPRTLGEYLARADVKAKLEKSPG